MVDCPSPETTRIVFKRVSPSTQTKSVSTPRSCSMVSMRWPFIPPAKPSAGGYPQLTQDPGDVCRLAAHAPGRADSAYRLVELKICNLDGVIDAGVRRERDDH